MADFKLMVVEDDDQDFETCRDCVSDFQKEKSCQIDLVRCISFEKAAERLDSSFDGAIIDLTLSGEGDGGTKVIAQIAELRLRIPVAVLTGTPDAADEAFTYIGVFKKGEKDASYSVLLDRFWEIHNTGLTEIMGGRGEIETKLSVVFQKNILSQIDVWVDYAKKDITRTKKALLRYVLNHLTSLLDDDTPFFPEEFYIVPSLTDDILTGSIVKNKETGIISVILTPACDLVIRSNGKYKTDRILLISIEDYEIYNQKGDIEKRQKNVKELYLHYMPEIKNFKGGFLNFRKIQAISPDEFDLSYGKPCMQVSPSFLKDIISRFSAYYARQGQPDIGKP